MVGGKCVMHLNALCSKDELGHQRWDPSLIKHGVSDTLQQRFHRGHAVHQNTLAQETVLKQQKHQTWAHLKQRQMCDHEMQWWAEPKHECFYTPGINESFTLTWSDVAEQMLIYFASLNINIYKLEGRSYIWWYSSSVCCHGKSVWWKYPKAKTRAETWF